ncbi:MAG: hypothetical protein U7126_25905 [Microcoleus sp.]
MQVIVEGWRFIDRSSCVANQFQLLEMLDRPEGEIFHRDLPYIDPDWQTTTSLFDRPTDIVDRCIGIVQTINSQQPTANSQQSTTNSQQSTVNSQQSTSPDGATGIDMKHYCTAFPALPQISLPMSPSECLTLGTLQH